MATNYLNKNFKDQEAVDIVDKIGKVIGKATRSQVYKEGLLHPAVSIIVVNKKGQIFIQRRSPKKILPLYWDISASEHVKSGESYRLAAIRGLQEELFITTSVKLLRKKHLQRNEHITKDICVIEYELVELYGVVYDGRIKINQDEVLEGQFVSFKKLNELIKKDQIKFSPWGLDEINYLFNNPNIIFELMHQI